MNELSMLISKLDEMRSKWLNDEEEGLTTELSGDISGCNFCRLGAGTNWHSIDTEREGDWFAWVEEGERLKDSLAFRLD